MTKHCNDLKSVRQLPGLAALAQALYLLNPTVFSLIHVINVKEVDTDPGIEVTAPTSVTYFMLHMLFPIHCSLCNARLMSNHYLCSSCIKSLPKQFDPIFFKEGVTCFAPFLYEGTIQWMLKQLKFGKSLLYANILGRLMAEALHTHYPTLPSLIIPMPLHTRRLQQRGFNQSLEIAKCIARRIPIPISKNQVIRHKATKPQAQCKAYERTQNIKGAFKIKKHINSDHIILMDDVITTGSTILECYHTLKNAGIRHIYICSIAKTT